MHKTIRFSVVSDTKLIQDIGFVNSWVDRYAASIKNIDKYNCDNTDFQLCNDCIHLYEYRLKYRHKTTFDAVLK